MTAGGLIQSGNHFYLVVVDDLSLLGWSSCATTGSSTKLKDHRRCLTMTRHIDYHRSSQETVGVIGQLVHFSIDQGYGLVRLKSEWIRNDLEAIRQDAVPVDGFNTYVDTPIVMDFVEFVTAGGEQVTGVVIAQQFFCVEAGNSKRKVEALVVNTSSYSVRPEDCGTWVRRSVASNRPFLLGHIIGCSDDGGSTMLVLPFTHFREDLRQVVRRRAFNLPA